MVINNGYNLDRPWEHGLQEQDHAHVTRDGNKF